VKPIDGIPIVFAVFIDDAQVTVRLRFVVRDGAVFPLPWERARVRVRSLRVRSLNNSSEAS
jgi:hypothetical protein